MWKDILLSVGDEDFGEKLRDAINQNGLTVKEFAEKYDIPEGSIYKITSGTRLHFNTKLLRKLVDGLQHEEDYVGKTIGLISTRDACDRAPSVIEVDEHEYRVKLLPANSIEEEIIKGVNAEKGGIDGILCGPIAATTLEQVVDVPVAGLQFDSRLMRTSLEEFAKKID